MITEELKRRSFVVNIILFGLFFLSIVALIHKTLLFLWKMNVGDGTPFWVPIFFVVLFAFLLKLSKLGCLKTAATIAITTITLITFQISLTWGLDVPQSLVTYGLIIVMSGIMISPKAAFFLVAIIGSFLVGTHYLETHKIISFSQNWKLTEINLFDISVLITTYLVIASISWLSSREMNKSLKRAVISEKNARGLAKKLQKQRDNLEILVKKRTQQLRENQFQQLSQVNTFARYGKIVSGILHNINNPLTVIALNLDSLRDESRIENMKLVKTALSASKNIEDVIKSSRQQLVVNIFPEKFNLTEEVKETLVLFNHHFLQNNIELKFSRKSPVYISGIPSKLSQVVSNLIMNSIESFEVSSYKKNFIEIQLYQKSQKIIFTIKDNGKGINEKDQKKLFSPLYTTKGKRGGTGLGLFSSKKIIEEYFNGRISFESQYGVGSKFIIELPRKTIT